jgi:hypothetical protein
MPPAASRPGSLKAGARGAATPTGGWPSAVVWCEHSTVTFELSLTVKTGSVQRDFNARSTSSIVAPSPRSHPRRRLGLEHSINQADLHGAESVGNSVAQDQCARPPEGH